MRCLYNCVGIMILILLTSCNTPEVYKYPIKQFGATSVELDGIEITKKNGEFYNNIHNTWIQIGNIKSKSRTTNRKPKLIIKKSNLNTNAWFVRFNQESAYRYIYVTKKVRSIPPFPSEKYSIVKVNKQSLPDGSLLFEPAEDLQYGEYAIWVDNGSDDPKREDGEQKQHYKQRLRDFWAGVFWSFGVDDLD